MITVLIVLGALATATGIYYLILWCLREQRRGRAAIAVRAHITRMRNHARRRTTPASGSGAGSHAPRVPAPAQNPQTGVPRRLGRGFP